MEGLAIENPAMESVATSDFDPMDIDSATDENNSSKKEDLSLRLTESDSDDEPLLPRVTKTYNKAKAVIDSDEEQLTIALPADAAKENKHSDNDSEDDQLFGITSKPHRRIMRNESDDDSHIVSSKGKLSLINKNPSSDSEDDVPLSNVKSNKDGSGSMKKKRIKKALPSWVNSDDSSNAETIKDEDSNQTKNSSHDGSQATSDAPDWKSKLSSDLFSNDESSGNEEGYSLEDIKSKAKKKWKLAEDSSVPEPKSEKSRRSKSKTTTPKIAKEETQKIHSESQRMVRESSVSLPYHKPKQRSLTEFLNRKRVPTNPDRSLKPSLKDLDAVAQVLEDRAKEVETFFKSDSEGSDNEEKSNLESSSAVEASESKVIPAERGALEQPPADVAEPASLITDKEPIEDADRASKPFVETEKLGEEPIELVGKPRIVIDDPPEEIEATLSPQKAAENLVEKSDNDLDLSHSIAMDHKERLANLKRISIANVPKPSLHGRPGQFIDLDDDGDDSGSKAGVNKLIERFVEQVSSLKKSPRKKDVQLNIVKKVVSAEGQIELKKDVITVSVDEKHEPDSALSSGRRRQLVKDALRQSIAAKRAAERAKKQQEQRIDNEEDGADDGGSEKEEEILSDQPETDEDELGDDEEEDSTCKKSKKLKKKKREKGAYLDEEADVSGEDDLTDGSDHEDDEGDTNDVVEEPTLDRCDEDDSLDDASTVVRRTNSGNSAGKEAAFGFSVATSSSVNNLSLSPNLDVKTSDPIRDAFASSWQPGSSQDNMDELIGLCSGRFGPGEGKSEAGISRSLFGQSQANDDDEEDDDRGFMRILPAEDDDDEDEARPLDEDTELQVRAGGVLSDDEDEKDRSKRKKARLFISDDEEDQDEPGSKTGRRLATEEDDEAEENEEEEEMHEEEKEFRGISEFLDKEAELSGSEIGSGDENEDGEDDWEEEDGDKEDFDETQVRDQLGRAHLKTMLDQDQREVRLFQELFLEDGDLHSDGAGRQRQFRWKDAGADEGSQRPAGQKEDDEDDDSAEVEQDSAWRKMRQEREKWLQEQKAKQEAVVTDESDPPLLKRNVRVVRVNSVGRAAANQSTAKPEPAAGTNQQQKILSPKKPLANTMVKRGSFLRRSDKDLSTIASLTKSVLPVQTARTSSNFVFASLTPERPAAAAAGKTNENRKQKQMDSKDAPNPPAKKPKTSGASKSIFSFFQ